MVVGDGVHAELPPFLVRAGASAGAGVPDRVCHVVVCPGSPVGRLPSSGGVVGKGASLRTSDTLFCIATVA